MSTIDPIKCEEALKFLLQFIDRELPDGQHASMEQHLHICRSCFSRMEFELRLKSKFSALSSKDVSTQLRNRISAMIEKF